MRERVKTLEKSSMDPTLDKMLSLEKHFSEIKADVSDIKIAQVLQALSQQNYEHLPSFLPSFHSLFKEKSEL